MMVFDGLWLLDCFRQLDSLFLGKISIIIVSFRIAGGVYTQIIAPTLSVY